MGGEIKLLNKKVLLIMILAIFLTGMLCAYAVNPIDAKSTKTKFVGSEKSDKFHYKWCKFAKKIKSYNKIKFKSKKRQCLKLS